MAHGLPYFFAVFIEICYSHPASVERSPDEVCAGARLPEDAVLFPLCRQRQRVRAQVQLE